VGERSEDQLREALNAVPKKKAESLAKTHLKNNWESAQWPPGPWKAISALDNVEFTNQGMSRQIAGGSTASLSILLILQILSKVLVSMSHPWPVRKIIGQDSQDLFQ